MRLLSKLNPTSIGGKISFYIVLILIGYIISEETEKPCPPTKSVSVEQNIKLKKSSQLNSEFSQKEDMTCEEYNCEDWLKSLSRKEINLIRNN